MSRGPGLEKCSLLSVFVESVLWGILLLLYFITLYLLIQKRSKILKYTPHLLLVTLMLVLCTMHVVLSFRREMDAFFLAPSPLAYLSNTTDWNSRFRTSVHVIQILMTDFLIVFRSFYLWEKNYFIVIFPFVLVAVTLATGIGSLRVMSSSHPGPILETQLRSWMIAILALTITTKTICLLLVSFRARRVHSSTTSPVNRHVPVYTLMVVLIESGAVALGVCIALLPMLAAKVNAQYIVRDALSPILGITFVAIIAGMAVNLTDPTAFVSPARPIWNHHHNVPPPPRPPVPPADFRRECENENKVETSTTDPSSSSGSYSSTFRDLNKSTGTLNMAIVL